MSPLISARVAREQRFMFPLNRGHVSRVYTQRATTEN
jgi:hypothetical protein